MNSSGLILSFEGTVNNLSHSKRKHTDQLGLTDRREREEKHGDAERELVKRGEVGRMGILAKCHGLLESGPPHAKNDITTSSSQYLSSHSLKAQRTTTEGEMTELYFYCQTNQNASNLF